MKLYGHPMSTCTRKVLCTFAEKGVTPEFVLVDIMTGGGKSPEHLARQPFGQVPAIDDNGFVLYESRAIIRYLDEVLPGAPLTPKDAKGRATMEQWMSVEAANFYSHAMAIIYQLYFGPMRKLEPDMAKVTAAREKLNVWGDIMEKQLAKGPHILGDNFSLADISYMPYVEYLMPTSQADIITSRPKLAAWWKVVSARPSWQKAIGAA
ncbi:MAG: glutathione S-transferase N-terminal domain-containing protein [Polyangiaceae bacterium]